MFSGANLSFLLLAVILTLAWALVFYVLGGPRAKVKVQAMVWSWVYFFISRDGRWRKPDDAQVVLERSTRIGSKC